MNVVRLQQRINEFCKNGNLENYRPILEQIFQEIMDSGCSISARYDSPVSSHSKTTDTCRIKISLNQGTYKKPEHIIWTILHEFGHHFAPLTLEDKDNIDKIIESEEHAWEWALKKVNEIHEFREMLDDFTIFKEQYLQTYYTKRNSMTK